MAKRTDIKRVMIIGSGPIVIGQAAEFDYAGTQACLALKEEGYEVILVNSNPSIHLQNLSGIHQAPCNTQHWQHSSAEADHHGSPEDVQEAAGKRPSRPH